MRLDLDEYRRQIIERASGKVSDFYNAKTDEWKIGLSYTNKQLSIDAHDLYWIEHHIKDAYKAGLLDGLDEKDMACKNAFRDGALHAKMGMVKEMLND